MRASRAVPVALALCASLAIATTASASAVSSRAPATSSAKGATASPRPAGRIAPARVTDPGIGEPATRGAIPGRTVRGLILLAIAAAIAGWLARARVRDWMLGPSGR